MRPCECRDGLTCHECLCDINTERARLTEENRRLREKLEIMGKTEGFSADTKIEQAKHIEALESDLAVVRAALEKLAEWEDIDSAALIRVRLFAKEALQRMGEAGDRT